MTEESPPLVLPSLEDLRSILARTRLRDDPVSWVNETLGEFLWSKQRDIFESVRNNRRTAVRSCHSSGKSFVAARITAWWIETHPPGEAFVVTSAPTGRQVRAILWRQIGRAHAKGKLTGRTNQTEWWMTMPAGNEEMVAFGQKPADVDPTAFQGIHQRYVLVIFDEACGIPEPLWVAADSLLTNDASRFLAIGNPDDPKTEFCNVCKPGSGWKVIGISAYDTPNLTAERIPASLRGELVSATWVEEKLARWGETNPLYVSKVLGQFPETSEEGLIPVSWIRQAQERELEPDTPNELGIDVGGGAARNIIAHRRGPVVRIIRRDNNPNTMQTLGNAISDGRKTGASLIKIDKIGIGKGAVDRAEEIASDKHEDPGTRRIAEKIVGINVGDPPDDREGFVNLRAEGFWGLRERFQDGDIDIDPEDDDLAAQLVDLRYKRTSRGRIQIESKDEMRRRGKPSPDEADGVMLSFLVPARTDHVPLTWGRKRRPT